MATRMPLKNTPDAQGVAYRVVFDRASGVPDATAPVTLMGKRVGTVAASALSYDAVGGRMQVTATIVLEPRRIALANGGTWTETPGGAREQMDDLLRHLIAHGLHAELTTSPPVIGGEQVALRLGDGTPGALGAGPLPEIPTSGGGGVGGIMAEAGDVMTKVNQMPLPQIADNLLDISRAVARLTSSPALSATLRQLDRSTANLQQVTHDLDRDVPPALAGLRRTVTEAQSSLAAAQDLLSARGNAGDTPGSEGLPETLYEVTRTARALRELSDFLDRHPSALLPGRGANQ